MANRIKLLPLVLLFFLSVKSQNWELVASVEAKAITSVSIDNLGYLFIADKDGLIQKYDSKGKEVLSYSSSKSGAVSILESWPTIQTFAFYRDFQEFVFFDRFLAPGNRHDFNSVQIGYAQVATIGSRKRLWIFDESDLCLKQYDIQSNQILSNTFFAPLMETGIQEVNYIREYQNMVFVNNANEGIFIFDNIGNFEKKIPVSKLTYFNFINNELYYLQGKKLVFVNIYSLESRSKQVDINSKYKDILLHGKLAYLISDTGFNIYTLP